MNLKKKINVESLCTDLLNAAMEHNPLQSIAELIAKSFNADAVSIMRFENPLFYPLALHGFSKETYGRRFDINENPRLNLVCSHNHTTIFADDIDMPDPFDGLIKDKLGRLQVHSCSGIPVKNRDQLVGLIVMDSLTLGAFHQFKQSDYFSATDMVAKVTLQAMEELHLKELLLTKTNLNNALIKTVVMNGNEIIGNSLIVKTLKREISIVAPSDLSVLITGETGVGKELVARNIHALSKRFSEPIIYINCAALPENIAESELFGHVKGSYTGANSDRTGKFELANKGTIFLDEIGELSLSIQASLLRAIQCGDIQKVGGDKKLTVDVRVVAATNKNLPNEVELGNFREDLYHRLNVYPIHVASLRDRLEDIELLTGYFLEKNKTKLGMQSIRIQAEAVEALRQHSWFGNIRELEHVISRAMLRAAAANPNHIVTLKKNDLGILSKGLKKYTSYCADQALEDLKFGLSLNDVTATFQKELLTKLLSDNESNWSVTADCLGIDKANIHRLGRRLGLK